MLLGTFGSRRKFKDLGEQEILALMISSEEDDAQIYCTYAAKVRAEYPTPAETGHMRLGETLEAKYLPGVVKSQPHIAGSSSPRFSRAPPG